MQKTPLAIAGLAAILYASPINPTAFQERTAIEVQSSYTMGVVELLAELNPNEDPKKSEQVDKGSDGRQFTGSPKILHQQLDDLVAQGKIPNAGHLFGYLKNMATLMQQDSSYLARDFNMDTAHVPDQNNADRTIVPYLEFKKKNVLIEHNNYDVFLTLDVALNSTNDRSLVNGSIMMRELRYLIYPSSEKDIQEIDYVDCVGALLSIGHVKRIQGNKLDSRVAMIMSLPEALDKIDFEGSRVPLYTAISNQKLVFGVANGELTLIKPK